MRMRWFLPAMALIFLLFVALVIFGCSEMVEEVTAPEPVEVVQFTADESVDSEPVIQMLLDLKHCEQFGLGIDMPDDFHSWEPQPDSSGGE